MPNHVGRLVAPQPRRGGPRWTHYRETCKLRFVWRQCAAVTALAFALVGCGQHSGSGAPLPLRSVGEITLPGNGSRFDYASVDPARGLLFIAHLGASEVIEVDLRARRVVRTVSNISQVHGVLVVPQLHRVYATATGVNQVVALDEDTGEVLARAATGDYPDGLAYDSRRNTVWTTNETGGSETVVDAATLQGRGTVELGGEVGNVVYDPRADRMVVAVQGRDDLAGIVPETLTVERRIALPGCQHPHGLSLDHDNRLAFVACDQNATAMAVDQMSGNILSTVRVGDNPDVLAYDAGLHRLYVACESGWVTILDLHDRTLAATASAYLADGAHVVAVNPNTHHSYYPVPAGADGRPALLERDPG
jgi:DNA-binding beta-propeller fold protein YncE